MQVADYAYFISDGVAAAQGTIEEIKNSKDPFVRQFVDSLPDGPVAFHYPGKPYDVDLRVGNTAIA